MKKIFLIIPFFFLGCVDKQIETKYIYIQPKKFQFQKIKEPKARKIRVYKKDVKLYNAYIKQFRSIIQFYEKQIDLYNKEWNKTIKIK